jgi:hypothetical protein
MIFMPCKIWIDLSNAPHALFFRPIIHELSRRKIKCLVTAREQEQLIDLISLFDIKHRIVGKYGGKSLLSKIIRMFQRIFLLWLFAMKEKPRAVIVHQSFYGIIAGFFARVPKRVYIFDNEKAWIQNLLAIPFATHVICPEAIPLKRMFFKKLIKYDGIKEAVYLHNFKPERNVFESLSLNRRKKLLVVRPEPYTAHYYSGRGTALHEVINEFLKTKEWQIVIVPRDEKQRSHYKNLYSGEADVLVLDHVVDLPSLIYFADAVISAGGTVAREAVVLGKPAISLYEGKQLAVDRWLAMNGYLFTLKKTGVKNLPNLIKSKKIKKFESKNIDILRYLI